MPLSKTDLSSPRFCSKSAVVTIGSLIEYNQAVKLSMSVHVWQAYGHDHLICGAGSTRQNDATCSFCGPGYFSSFSGESSTLCVCPCQV